MRNDQRRNDILLCAAVQFYIEHKSSQLSGQWFDDDNRHPKQPLLYERSTDESTTGNIDKLRR